MNISPGDFLAITFWLFEIGFFVSLCFNMKYHNAGKKKVTADEGS